MSTTQQFTQEIAEGERFEFGQNWSNFLHNLNDTRIHEAEKSLTNMLTLDENKLANRTFLDAGSGSGLFSLAARRLGARVHSFDYDPQSVACTNALKQRFFMDDPDWQIEHGSVLDQDYLQSLGTFDYVYSWGVLHHTGEMWNALNNIHNLVNDNGFLFIALYNDPGWKSKLWLLIKRTYNMLPAWLRTPYIFFVMVPRELRVFLRYLLKLRPQDYFAYWRNYNKKRGMNRWHDIVDWVGGYPFEVATFEEIVAFYKQHGFVLVNSIPRDGSGCNEFVFQRQVRNA